MACRAEATLLTETTFVLYMYIDYQSSEKPLSCVIGWTYYEDTTYLDQIKMNEPSEYLEIVNLSHALDIDVESGTEEYSWETFRDNLLAHDHRKFKDGPGFIPAIMKPREEWRLLKTKTGKTEHYRFDENFAAISALVIDADKPGALEEAEALFEGYEYVVYSTHNFTPNTPWKFRIVVRLAEPIIIEDWQDCFEALKSRINLDSSCRNPSRFYYYPSHSVDSYITPRAFYRSGKAITKEEILNLAAPTATKNPFSRVRTMGTLPIREARVKRHFSGKNLSRYDHLPKVLDFSKAGYEERHARSIADYLKDDSRHNLALSITSREYSLFGPRVDLRSLLVFIYQTALRGSKPLENGNTPDELPDMIITGMEKYAPEAYQSLLDNYGDKATTHIISEIQWAETHYQGIEDRHIIQAPTIIEDSYQMMRQRHIEFLRKYAENGDLDALVSRICEMELKEESPRYRDIAKSILKYHKGYLIKVARMNEKEAVVSNQSELKRIAERIKKGELSAKYFPEDKRKYFRSAILVELRKTYAESTNSLGIL